MEVSSYKQEDDGQIGGRTLSDISISSNASGKINWQAQNSSSLGASKHVRDTRVKLLCSYGGKILPRPSDKRLRYVGGDTRMITVPRHIQLAALRLKLAEVYGHDITLKYQLPEEDLDALVSVSLEEDLENMMEECDRLDSMEGSSRLRVFVFSSSDQDAINFNEVADPKVSEHRYVEAVNTVQTDVPSRLIENVLSTDVLKNSSGIHPSYAWNSSEMQEKFPKTSESLHSYAYPLEQFLSAGSHPFSVLPKKDDLLGHIALPSHVAVGKPWKELPSSLHTNNMTFHGPPVAMNDFLDLDSERIAHRIDENQIPRAEPRVQREAKIDGSTQSISIASILQTSEPIYNLNAMVEDSSQVYEEQPLSPGALLQRQLQQADQILLETASMSPFVKQSSQSSLDGNDNEPKHFPESEQTENLPIQQLVNDNIREGLFATSMSLLSQPFKIPVKLPFSEGPSFPFFPGSDRSSTLVQSETAEKPSLLSQQGKLEETSLHPAAISLNEDNKSLHNHGSGDLNVVSELVQQPCTDSSLLSGLQTSIGDVNKLYELDGSKDHVLLTTTAAACHIPVTGSDFCIGTEATWLVPDLVSLPHRDDPQVDMLDETKHQTLMVHAPSVQEKWIAGAGISLLDDPIDYNGTLLNAPVSDIKLDPTSATTLRESSMVDIRSDLLPSAPTKCSSLLPDPLFTSVLEPLAKLGKDEMSLLMATDALSLDETSENTRIGLLCDTDHLQQSLNQETTAVGFRIDDTKADICKKGIVDVDVSEGGAAFAGGFSSITLLNEAQSAPALLEDEPILYSNYEQDMLEAISVMEGDLTIQSLSLEVKEAETFSCSADMPMNAAAVAEAEAIARGLQTIRNFDLEELRELGSGTFGTVYHGKWRGTDVAIKRIKPSCFTGRPSERERLIADFWQEAFILGQLHHPNVVAFYGVVPDGPDGTLATVTEYMVNGSLKQALQKDRIVDRRKRLIIAMDAAFGMEYLHKKNVVHFDLKCENLLVNLRDIQRPICKVGDLGLSKVKQQTMISGGVRGTLPWMAPELLNGSSSLVSEKVDVFSFGIVLWELLTGEEPYASMHYGAIIGGIVTNTLRPPVPRWCDPAWRSLMEACWAADPSERPTFTEIANSLRAMEAAFTAKGQGQAQNVE